MADSRPVAGNVQDEAEISFFIRKQRNKRIFKRMQK